jgi:hypothetical protein
VKKKRKKSQKETPLTCQTASDPFVAVHNFHNLTKTVVARVTVQVSVGEFDEMIVVVIEGVVGVFAVVVVVVVVGKEVHRL